MNIPSSDFSSSHSLSDLNNIAKTFTTDSGKTITKMGDRISIQNMSAAEKKLLADIHQSGAPTPLLKVPTFGEPVEMKWIDGPTFTFEQVDTGSNSHPIKTFYETTKGRFITTRII